MALDIKIPAVGESISEVTISKWNKKSGDTVQMDEVLCELESDKATFELNAPAAGTLQIVVQEGETVGIDTLIARIEDANGKPAAPQAAAAASTSAPTDQPKPTAFADERPQTYAVDKEPAKPAAQPQPTAANGQVVEMKVPTVGESITEVTIGTWHKNDGDAVQVNDLLCEIESDKATFELIAEQAGTLRIVAQAGTTLPIGGVICRIETTAGAAAAPQPAATPTQPVQATQPAASGEKTYATGTPSPAAQKILAEKGVEPAQVQGTGVDGRITKEDAMKAQRSEVRSPRPKTPAAPGPSVAKK